MKINNRHLSAAVIVAGLVISGCSQQQAAVAVPVVESVPEAAPVVDYVPEPVPQPEMRPAPVVPPVKRPVPVARPVLRPAPVVVPKVKAKGNYRGAVEIDRNSLQQYQY